MHRAQADKHRGMEFHLAAIALSDCPRSSPREGLYQARAVFEDLSGDRMAGDVP